MAGKFLAAAAISHHKNALWLSSYASRVRGGSSECTVIFSGADIESPVLSEADVIIWLIRPYIGRGTKKELR